MRTAPPIRHVSVRVGTAKDAHNPGPETCHQQILLRTTEQETDDGCIVTFEKDGVGRHQRSNDIDCRCRIIAVNSQAAEGSCVKGRIGEEKNDSPRAVYHHGSQHDPVSLPDSAQRPPRPPRRDRSGKKLFARFWPEILIVVSKRRHSLPDGNQGRSGYAAAHSNALGAVFNRN